MCEVTCVAPTYPVTHHLSQATANPETMGKIRELAICVQLMLVISGYTNFVKVLVVLCQDVSSSACSHVLP